VTIDQQRHVLLFPSHVPLTLGNVARASAHTGRELRHPLLQGRSAARRGLGSPSRRQPITPARRGAAGPVRCPLNLRRIARFEGI
jgi:hypothetical protein